MARKYASTCVLLGSNVAGFLRPVGSLRADQACAAGGTAVDAIFCAGSRPAATGCIWRCKLQLRIRRPSAAAASSAAAAAATAAGHLPAHRCAPTGAGPSRKPVQVQPADPIMLNLIILACESILLSKSAEASMTSEPVLISPYVTLAPQYLPLTPSSAPNPTPYRKPAGMLSRVDSGADGVSAVRQADSTEDTISRPWRPRRRPRSRRRSCRRELPRGRRRSRACERTRTRCVACRTCSLRSNYEAAV